MIYARARKPPGQARGKAGTDLAKPKASERDDPDFAN